MKRALLLHNYYIHKGGEDIVFTKEKSLLEKFGCSLNEYSINNEDLSKYSFARNAFNTIWNNEVYRRIDLIIKQSKPDIIHCYNTFPMLSPSVYYAAKKNKVPVIQRLPNYRLFCPNGLLLRNGQPCEICLHTGNPMYGFFYKCYRGSYFASFVVACMIFIHRLLGTWNNEVDAYICLTSFSRGLFIKAGLPKEKLEIKPNFLPLDPGVSNEDREFCLYVGRLSHEKGVNILLEAWKKNKIKHQLVIIGDGPSSNLVIDAQNENPYIIWLGKKQTDEILRFMKKAHFLIIPSICYENFPNTLVESFACGTPVIASDIGATRELVDNNFTGLHFRSGDSEDLARKIMMLLNKPLLIKEMQKNCRAEYEAKYTAERNYQMLMEIYQTAIERNRARKPSKFLGGITRLVRKQNL